MKGLQRAASVQKAEAPPARVVRVGDVAGGDEGPPSSSTSLAPGDPLRIPGGASEGPGAWPWGQPGVGAWGHQRQVSTGFTF